MFGRKPCSAQHVEQRGYGTCFRRLRWIFQTEHLAVVVVGEGFGVPGPADNGPQALLGRIGCHVVLKLVKESASRGLVGRALVEDAANVPCKRNIAQEMSLKKP